VLMRAPEVVRSTTTSQADRWPLPNDISLPFVTMLSQNLILQIEMGLRCGECLVVKSEDPSQCTKFLLLSGLADPIDIHVSETGCCESSRTKVWSVAVRKLAAGNHVSRISCEWSLVFSYNLGWACQNR